MVGVVTKTVFDRILTSKPNIRYKLDTVCDFEMTCEIAYRPVKDIFINPSCF